MPEWGPLGSVRGALSNERPYRDLRNVVAKYPFGKVAQISGDQVEFWLLETIRVLSCGVAETQLGPSAAEMARFAAILSACLLLSWTGPARSDGSRGGQ